MPSYHQCNTMDEYRAVFNHFEKQGLQFGANTEPFHAVNYIKQEGPFFTRISEDEFNEYNQSDENNL